MTKRELLNRLAIAMIDWQADMRSDIVAHYHRSPTLDRLRRQLLMTWTMQRMTRTMLEAHKALGERSLVEHWREILATLDADQRAVLADIQAEDRAADQGKLEHGRIVEAGIAAQLKAAKETAPSE
jgi:hypothetical protein